MAALLAGNCRQVSAPGREPLPAVKSGRFRDSRSERILRNSGARPHDALTSSTIPPPGSVPDAEYRRVAERGNLEAVAQGNPAADARRAQGVGNAQAAHR